MRAARGTSIRPRTRARASRPVSPDPGLAAAWNRTSEWGRSTGSDRSTSPLTALKMVVLAPMPSASDSRTTNVPPRSASGAGSRGGDLGALPQFADADVAEGERAFVVSLHGDVAARG